MDPSLKCWDLKYDIENLNCKKNLTFVFISNNQRSSTLGSASQRSWFTESHGGNLYRPII